MESLAIVRATDILKLNTKLLEMQRAGLNFESKPKEINPASVEKILSLDADIKYEVCALVPLSNDYELSNSKVKSNPLLSDVLVLDISHKFFDHFVKLIPVLPDLAISRLKDADKQPDLKEKTRVYLGVFVNRKVQVQTASDAMYTGVLKHADSIGVFFEPSDNSDPLFITWHDIKKIIIPKEGKN